MSAEVLSPGQVIEDESVAPADTAVRENLNRRIFCPYCETDPPNLVEDFASGTIVCDDCATVLSENIVDSRSEWRTFANDDQAGDDPSRVGASRNNLLNGSQLSSEIAFAGGDARARDLTRAQNRLNENKGNKALLQAYAQITAYAEALHLVPIITETTKELFKAAQENKMFRGKSQDAIIASCILLACRLDDTDRPYHKLARITRVSKRDIGRLTKLLDLYFSKHFGSKKGAAGGLLRGGYVNNRIAKPRDRCAPNAAALGLPVMIGLIAGDFADLCVAKGPLLGRSPSSVSAFAVYVIANFFGHFITAKECGAACHVSDGTIRSQWKNVFPMVEELLDPEWYKKEKGGKLENLPPL